MGRLGSPSLGSNGSYELIAQTKYYQYSSIHALYGPASTLKEPLKSYDCREIASGVHRRRAQPLSTGRSLSVDNDRPGCF